MKLLYTLGGYIEEIRNAKECDVMKKVMLLVLVLVLGVAFVGCSLTDVVGKVAVTSFDAILTNPAVKITTDEVNNGWSLTSPGGERFVWSKDFSVDKKPDLMMELDAKPFLEAGLDPAKLDKDTYLYDSTGNILMIHSEQGTDKFTNTADTKPIDSFKQIVGTHRSSIGYHEKLDHYGVKFGNGNMFEWAKDIKTNDKDIVFILNPQPFIDAGVDPAKVAGWVFAKVEIKDDNGKSELVDKLLKPYEFK